MIPIYLSFSDSAKYAEAAKNLISGNGFIIHHSFFDLDLLKNYHPGAGFPANFLPFTSWILAAVFKLFPVTDTIIAITGWLFLFFSALLIILIGKRLHSLASGLLAAVFFFFSIFFHEYAKNASTEIFLTFEILSTIYLLFLSGKKRLFAVIPLILIFFTRQQAPVFALALVFWWLTLFPHRLRVWISVFALLLFVTAISFFGRHSVFSPAHLIGAIVISAGTSGGQQLRGAPYMSLTLTQIATKTFYNFYNFIKSPDRLTSPLIFLLALSALFLPKLSFQTRKFLNFSFICLLLFILAASATIPNARYIHPVMPLIFIAAAIGLMEISIGFRWQKLFLTLSVGWLILPTVGFYTLDARFRAAQFNTQKPPARKVISDIMAKNIPVGHLIITNLDAWAAWYQSLTTMWFPLSPDYLIPASGSASPVDYIVITDYLGNDGDFALGPWKEVLDSPQNLQNLYLKQNFRVLTTFRISPGEVYENQYFSGTILVRK